MCGIAGFCNLPRNWEENINRMNRRMSHRGPDGSGVWCADNQSVVLGHQRLSIVDLTESGAQPMESASGRFVLAFNGEIYNYKDLEAELLRDGCVKAFRGTSDTEVLLELMEAYGIEAAVSKCKGMFAIALFDKQEEKLYLIRDRVGEKPLYYGFAAGGFVFASDVGSIASLSGFQNPIYQEVLELYFVHGYIPAPYSIYQDIYKLEPGMILELAKPYREPGIKAYWSMKETARRGQEHLFTGSRAEAARELERLLKNAIGGQMMADVPVGAFLSAGIDSSTVVALMQSLSKRQVKSFTIGMADQAYNEAITAKEIAKHLGTEHTELYITENDAKEVIPKLAHIFSEPFADSSQIPTYLVSRMTGEHVTVSLSGDGGDELFCGYGSYESIGRLWGRLDRVPLGIRWLCGSLVLLSPLKKKKSMCTRAMLLRAGSPEELYRLSNEGEGIAKEIPLMHGNPAHQYGDYKPGTLQELHHNIMLMDMLMYHPDDILTKVDRTAMAVSLETRVPMLDQDVVEFAWTLPQEYLKQNGRGKLVLRDVLYQYVPGEMMERPKTGFSIPISKWLRQPGLRAWAETLLERKALEKQGILNAETVWKIWDDFIEKGIWRAQIWYILMFQEWMSVEKRG